MFWCDIVRSGKKFCVCQGSWSNLIILNSEVVDNILNVYFTAEDGATCLIFSQRKGEEFPKRLDMNFHFKPLQHVRILAEGGNVTLIGEAFDGSVVKKSEGYFLANCPFGDENDWKINEKINESRALVDRNKPIDCSRKPNIQERLKCRDDQLAAMESKLSGVIDKAVYQLQGITNNSSKLEADAAKDRKRFP